MTYKDELKLIIKAEVDKAIRDLGAYNKVTGKAESTTVAFAKAANLVKKTLAGAGLGVSLTILIAKLNSYAKSASQAEEVSSKFSVVFREIADQAEIVARKYAQAFDVADSTAMTLLGNVGDLLTGMGASQSQALELAEAVTILGTDLASFTNYAGGASGAVEALIKMMLGEREMVKSLGIVIRENDVQQRLAEKGLKDLTGTAKLLATAQVSLELATEQSKNSIGDYARTADSTANVNRRLKESFKTIQEQIGNTVNTAITPMKAAFADFLDTVAEANEKISVNSLMLDIKMGVETINSLKSTAEQVDTLVDEYETLTSKTSLNADEQDRLYAVIQDIAAITPSAVTYFDEYGEALGVSAEKAREFADTQRELSRLQLEIQMGDYKLLQLEQKSNHGDLIDQLEEATSELEEWEKLQKEQQPVKLAVELALDELDMGTASDIIIEKFKDSIPKLDQYEDDPFFVETFLEGLQTNLFPNAERGFDTVDRKVQETTIEIQKLRNQLNEIELTDLQIQQIEELLNALNGDYSLMIGRLESQIESQVENFTGDGKLVFEQTKRMFEKEYLTAEEYVEKLQFILENYSPKLSQDGSSTPETPGLLAIFDQEMKAIDTVAGKYSYLGDVLHNLGIEFDAESQKSVLVKETFDKLMESDLPAEEIQAFVDSWKEYLQISETPTAIESVSEALQKQLKEIENTAVGFTELGLEYDKAEARQEALVTALETLSSMEDVTPEKIQEFLALFSDIDITLPDPEATSFDRAIENLESAITAIGNLETANNSLGIAYDAAEAKSEAVISAMKSLAAAEGISADQMNEFIQKYREYIQLDEDEPVFSSVTEKLDHDLAAIDRLKAGYDQLGLEYDDQEMKQQAVLSAMSELANSTDGSADKLQEFIDAYGEWIDKNEEAATGFKAIKQEFENFTWDNFIKNLESSIEENLIDSLNGFFKDVGKQIGSGKLDAEPLVKSIIQEGTSMIAKAAGPYAPLVNLAGGILEGLTSAIFETIEAAEQAEEALSEANTEITELFTDVLDLEQELADQRIEAIEDEMNLLEQNRDLRLEILRDQWQRGEITGEEYFNQASSINAEYAANQEALDNQETLITGVQDVIAGLQEELDGMSGWTKFWTHADEDLSSQIAQYQELLDAISSDPDGLTEDEISQLASQYNITVPAAATGADFITSGKQLLMVGDNPGGRERIQVTPVSSPNIHGPGKENGLTININAPVYGVDDLYLKLEKAGRKMQKLGRTG